MKEKTKDAAGTTTDRMAGVSRAPGMAQDRPADLLRAIPKVDVFLKWVAAVGAEQEVPAMVLKNAVRETLEGVRARILTGEEVPVPTLSRPALLARFHRILHKKMTPRFRPVINATGVVIHTNLGRSLLPAVAMAAIAQAGARYGNLEFDLDTGRRGSRYSLVEELVCELTGAEAACVVNNNAAAVLLVLDTLAKGREVIVSRGELVEIGGSFRIPDVMARSGARMVEVGATNRTHLRDYERAITPETAMFLKVHRSNFRIIGFTAEPAVDELAALARERGLLFMEDLGSGSLIGLARFGLSPEPTVGEIIRSGVDVVTFSGDKLLGGPQAGLILGKAEVVARVKKNPLNRALRIDKFTLAGLEAVLRLYYDEDEAIATIPTLAMLAMPYDTIRRKAGRLLRRLGITLAGHCRLGAIDTESRAGGGSLPEEGLRTRAVTVAPTEITVNELERRLRTSATPVIGRIDGEQLLLDMRTVLDAEIPMLEQALKEAFEEQVS